MLVELGSLVVGLSTCIANMVLGDWFVKMLRVYMVFKVNICTCSVAAIFKGTLFLVVVFLLFS